MTQYNSNQPAQLQKLTSLEILDTAPIGLILSSKQISKTLIRLCGSTGWSASLLFTYGIRQVFSWRGSYMDLFVVLFGFNIAFNNCLVISIGCLVATGSSMLTFYSTTSSKYHAPDTWHDTIPSHIILTMGRPVLALPHKSECQARKFSAIFLVYRTPGSNTWPPIPRSGHSTDWATGPIFLDQLALWNFSSTH